MRGGQAADNDSLGAQGWHGEVQGGVHRAGAQRIPDPAWGGREGLWRSRCLRWGRRVRRDEPSSPPEASRGTDSVHRRNSYTCELCLGPAFALEVGFEGEGGVLWSIFFFCS